ncbi:ribokinase [Paraburkholderia sp. J12]|uniref:ribokinase n=1 Tax=Paraburkholderia sp. J12 TaxID=2805432 RepID=UPI002ABE9B65|nr:ribokinase [Paraburkholderia sp. J12]
MSKETKPAAAVAKAAGKVVVVGSINTDLVARSPHLPRPGETISGHEFSQVAGGKGANQAVAAARIGAQVAMVGCVGGDANGEQRRRDLEAEGIDCTGIEVSDSQPTGVALITVSDEGQNTIVVVAGSNGALTPEGVRRHEAMLRSADVVVCQLESPWEAVHATLELARRLGKTTVLNPAPATEPLPAEWMPLIDYLVPNEVEAAILAGLPVESESGARRAAMELQRAGACNVIVTLGAQGAYLLREGGEGAHFAAPEVQAVDTTAAGDTFIGVFAAQLAARQPLDAAIGLAQRAAAISVTRAGAQPSIPTRDEVERMG